MIELTEHRIKPYFSDRIRNFAQLLRISHWSKSIFVLLGALYSQNVGYFIPALQAALAFCLISSAVYIYNDIEDRSEDSLHPHKCNRPIACGKIRIGDAIFMLFALLLGGLSLGWMVSKPLAIILAVYLVINLAYNHVFKLIPILDVLCIAMGFLLRVLAGTAGIGLQASIWLAVVATLLSLFIALNKRQLELQLGLKHATRKALKNYHPVVLHWLIIGTGVACFLVYVLYVFYKRDEAFYFLLSVPFSAIALWRFTWLSTQNVANDDPVAIFLNDRLSRINLYCFIALSLMALMK